MNQNKKDIEDELAELEAELDKEEESKLKDEQKGPDLYPDILEDKYHNVEKMVSLGVIEKENICLFDVFKPLPNRYFLAENR